MTHAERLLPAWQGCRGSGVVRGAVADLEVQHVAVGLVQQAMPVGHPGGKSSAHAGCETRAARLRHQRGLALQQGEGGDRISQACQEDALFSKSHCRMHFAESMSIRMSREDTWPVFKNVQVSSAACKKTCLRSLLHLTTNKLPFPSLIVGRWRDA